MTKPTVTDEMVEAARSVIILQSPNPWPEKYVISAAITAAIEASGLVEEIDFARTQLKIVLEANEKLIARANEAEEENARLRERLNTPEVNSFTDGVILEAQHQRERWGAAHDAGKGPLDWFWLIGYLAQKAADAHMSGNQDKALHHCISTAAALANWHAAISGTNQNMRPGIGPGNAVFEALNKEPTP